MSIKIKSKLSEGILWGLISVSLPWYVFVVALLMDPFGFIPIALIFVAGVSLYLRHEFLIPALQLWAIYLVINSGLKLIAVYMESIGAITYDGSSFGTSRHAMFFSMAFFLLYFSRMQIQIKDK